MINESIVALRNLKAGQYKNELARDIDYATIGECLEHYQEKSTAKEVGYFKTNGTLRIVCPQCSLQFQPAFVSPIARVYRHYCPRCGQSLKIDREKLYEQK